MRYNHNTVGNAAVCGIFMLFCMAGCGVTAVSTSGSSSSGSTSTRTATPTAGPRSPPQPGASPAVTIVPSGGQVSVTLDKSQYSSGETILVSIQNGLATSIMVPDHQTNCTTVSLQMQTAGGGWMTVNPCRLMTVTRLHEIAAGATIMVHLIPAAQSSASTTWMPGTYRVAIRYGSGAVTAGKGVVIYPATFAIT